MKIYEIVTIQNIYQNKFKSTYLGSYTSIPQDIKDKDESIILDLNLFQYLVINLESRLGKQLDIARHFMMIKKEKCVIFIDSKYHKTEINAMIDYTNKTFHYYFSSLPFIILADFFGFLTFLAIAPLTPNPSSSIVAQLDQLFSLVILQSK